MAIPSAADDWWQKIVSYFKNGPVFRIRSKIQEIDDFKKLSHGGLVISTLIFYQMCHIKIMYAFVKFSIYLPR